jgi:hypothetical protein
MDDCNKYFISWNEFLKDAKVCNDLQLTQEEINELMEFHEKSIQQRDRDWSLISNWVVGAEPIGEA